MRARTKWVAPLVGGALLVGGASCSSGNGNGNGGAGSGLSLVSECDQICSQVGSCGAPINVVAQCQNACGNLALAPLGCVDPFAAYLACLGGANSVQCMPGGAYVFVGPAQCDADRQALIGCNAGPSPVAACVQLPGNSTCGVAAPASMHDTFCIGQPSVCTSPSPNPLGIGTFCCPPA